MRFLITPNYPNPYDQRMVRGLATGLIQVGQNALALDRPLADSEAAEACRNYEADVLLQVNRFRPLDPPLPPKVRHIGWFQDVFPETLNGNVTAGTRSSDIVYALGDAHVLGLTAELPCRVGCLVSGVDEQVLRAPAGTAEQIVDFSLCGYIPPPVRVAKSRRYQLLSLIDRLAQRVPLLGRANVFWLARRVLFRRYIPVDYIRYETMMAFKAITETLYQPLHGDLDIHLLSSAMWDKVGVDLRVPAREGAGRASGGRGADAGEGQRRARALRYVHMAASLAPDPSVALERVIGYFARDYPRLLDRITLVTDALAVSQSLELYGSGWATHDRFRPYWKGVLNRLEELLTAYRRSRINLANNTHGLGLHSRTLECMAVGGFIFMHRSPHDAKPGGMHTAFEPGVHYGMYTPENFRESAERWLRDDRGRTEAGQRAAKLIGEKHLWRHRAAQLLGDLVR